MSNDQSLADKITAELAAKGIVTEAPKTEEVALKAPEAESAPEEKAADEASEIRSEVEQEAMKKGWKPDGPKSAEEFLRAEPLYDRIHKQNKTIKSLTTKLDALTKHVSSLKKAGYQEQINQIKTERANAVARSDLDSVDYYDAQLNQVKQELQQEEAQLQPEIHPAALAFAEKYKDILQGYSLEAKELREFVLARDNELGSYNLDPDVHMRTLESDMKTKFPHKFAVTKREEVPLVESDSRPVTAKRAKARFTFSDLSKEQKDICRYMEKRGVMTSEQYIKQLVDLGELN